MAKNSIKASLEIREIRAEWDEEGVWVYQAYNDTIAEWSLKHNQLGGPGFNPTRMTWIKPSFAWMLYRSGYATKQNQTRILKIKLGHLGFLGLLEHCKHGHGGGGSLGRIQWDPARDLFAMNGEEPCEIPNQRAIQIGLKGNLSREYVQSILAIEDVTNLTHQVAEHHRNQTMAQIMTNLPNERAYFHHLLTTDLKSKIGVNVLSESICI